MQQRERQTGVNGQYFMNNARRQQLHENPTYVSDLRGRRVSLLLERQGPRHLALALIEKSGEETQEICANGDSLDQAVSEIGDDVYDHYIMHTTGGIPRHLRIFKADSF